MSDLKYYYTFYTNPDVLMLENKIQIHNTTWTNKRKAWTMRKCDTVNPKQFNHAF